MAINDSQYKSPFSFYNTISIQTNNSEFEEYCTSTRENYLEILVGEHAHKRAKLSKDTFIHGKQRQPPDIISAIGNNFLLEKSLVKFFIKPEQHVSLLLQCFIKVVDKLICNDFQDMVFAYSKVRP